MFTDLIQTLEKKEKANYETIYLYFRTNILNGKICHGEKLPSLRGMSKLLKKSLNTIKLAYEQLLLEGYIFSKGRTGYYVSKVEVQKNYEPDHKLYSKNNGKKQNIDFDLNQSSIDEFFFPEKKWRSALNSISIAKTLQYGHWQGEYDLRNELSKYLFKSRAVNCRAENIIIGSGTQTLLCHLATVTGKSSIAFEEPGYNGARKIFKQLAWDLSPLRLDHEGIKIKSLRETKSKFLYCTPSHQFPTGIIYSVQRRQELLNWAKNNNSYIIEDDYDSEYRFFGKPVPSIHSLDYNNRVLYLCTFSKSFMPSLRMTYLVLPDELLEKFSRIQFEQTVSRHNQLALAKFMKDGDWDRHLRRMRKFYREKHDSFLSLFKEHFPGFKVSSDNAGLRILIKIKSRKKESWFIERAEKAGIRINGLEKTKFVPQRTEELSFMLGFGSVKISDLEKLAEKLKIAWEI